jgi:hypothetical protein
MVNFSFLMETSIIVLIKFQQVLDYLKSNF